MNILIRISVIYIYIVKLNLFEIFILDLWGIHMSRFVVVHTCRHDVLWHHMNSDIDLKALIWIVKTLWSSAMCYNISTILCELHDEVHTGISYRYIINHRPHLTLSDISATLITTKSCKQHTIDYWTGRYIIYMYIEVWGSINSISNVW